MTNEKRIDADYPGRRNGPICRNGHQDWKLDHRGRRYCRPCRQERRHERYLCKKASPRKTDNESLFKKWIDSFYVARSRCENKNNKKYRLYGGRGIRFLLTKEDARLLWNRDKASTLARPSIDRINPNGNYEINNCRFIELAENSRLGREASANMRRKVKPEAKP